MNNRLEPVEEQRLLIISVILATIIAVFALLPDGIWAFVKGMLLLSGISGFLFILLTGANLKYKNAGEIGDFRFGSNIRRFLYNQCIDTYGYNLYVIVVFMTASHFSLKDGVNGAKHAFWYGLVAGIVVLNVIYIFAYVSRVMGRKK